MQKILFMVKSRPSKDKPGRTNVVNRTFTEDGTASDEIIGKIRKVRGENGYTAFVLNTDGSRTQLDGKFSTRSQAGHAVQRASQSEMRAAKVAKREAAAKVVSDRKAAKVVATPAKKTTAKKTAAKKATVKKAA